MKFERKNWHTSGWKVVGRRGVIQYSLSLPGQYSFNPAQVERKAPGAPWRWYISDGYRRRKSQPCKSLIGAMRACERAVVADLKYALRMLQGVE